MNIDVVEAALTQGIAEADRSRGESVGIGILLMSLMKTMQECGFREDFMLRVLQYATAGATTTQQRSGQSELTASMNETIRAVARYLELPETAETEGAQVAFDDLKVQVSKALTTLGQVKQSIRGEGRFPSQETMRELPDQIRRLHVRLTSHGFVAPYSDYYSDPVRWIAEQHTFLQRILPAVCNLGFEPDDSRAWSDDRQRLDG